MLLPNYILPNIKMIIVIKQVPKVKRYQITYKFNNIQHKISIKNYINN